MVAVFEDFFSTLHPSRKSAIVIDNAPPHTSEYFETNKTLWKKRNVEICNFSTYSPELNAIEILWRFIKYVWLPFEAYLSLETLEEKLTEALLKIGTKFTISFA